MNLDSKQKNKIIESVNEKINSMAIKRFEIEVREKEETIHVKVLGTLTERRIGQEVSNLHFSYVCLAILKIKQID